MKHIKRFLESNESHLDLLEYFLDLEDKYDVNLKCMNIPSTQIYFVQIDFGKKLYNPKKILSDVWNRIRMVNSIGDFTAFYTYPLKDGSKYCEIRWGFEIPYSDEPDYSSTRQNRLMDSSWTTRSCMIVGERELSDYNNLVSEIRSVVKSYLKSALRNQGMGDYQRLLNIGDIEYIEGDFGDDLVLNYFEIYFRKN